LPDASVVETDIPVEADAKMGPPIVAPVRVTVNDPGITGWPAVTAMVAWPELTVAVDAKMLKAVTPMEPER